MTLQGCAANMGSKISLLVYEWPRIKCKICYMNGLIFQHFPKFEPKLAQILRKFWKNWVILLKIWQKIGPIGIRMGQLFWKNWYLYWSTFKFCGGTSLPKPNLSTPWGFPLLASLVCEPCSLTSDLTCWGHYGSLVYFKLAVSLELFVKV